jgi:hypothetical protein
VKVKTLKLRYTFGMHKFSSKKRAAQFFSEMRSRYRRRQPIDAPDDRASLWDLFQGHCDRQQKIGCGVSHFFTDSAPEPHQHTRCFYLSRIDGSDTDFGFPACVDGIRKLNVLSLRRAIRHQVEAYRHARLAGIAEFFVSEYSGESARIADAHVDHVIPFEEIVLRFTAIAGIDIESDLLTTARDNCSEPTWRDASMIQRFCDFHATFPLRLVTALENLSVLRGKK